MTPCSFQSAGASLFKRVKCAACRGRCNTPGEAGGGASQFIHECNNLEHRRTFARPLNNALCGDIAEELFTLLKREAPGGLKSIYETVNVR